MPQPPEGIRTYKLRRSRITAGQSSAIRDLGGRLLLSPSGTVPDEAWAGKYSAFVLEIGFGMGEGTLAYSLAQPEAAILAVDLHTPGIGNLLRNLAAADRDNVRVVEADALALLSDSIADGRLDGIRIFFPDPWPKARHHKRRLLSTPNLTLMAQRVRAGGFLHFATDWPDYAEWTRELLLAHPDWELLPPGESCALADPLSRPRTKFEERGINAGRPIADLVARRR